MEQKLCSLFDLKQHCNPIYMHSLNINFVIMQHDTLALLPLSLRADMAKNDTSDTIKDAEFICQLIISSRSNLPREVHQISPSQPSPSWAQSGI
jgi:hypothetical protein